MRSNAKNSRGKALGRPARPALESEFPIAANGPRSKADGRDGQIRIFKNIGFHELI
jgi:hypothetical protein